MHNWGALDMLIRPSTTQDDPDFLVFLPREEQKGPFSPSETQPKEVLLETILRKFNVLRRLARKHNISVERELLQAL
eukprot:1055538-Pyramimonas_sp.AAC.1